jgi:hypothetical protein
LRDRTTLAVELEVADGVAVEVDEQFDLVPAERVVALECDVVRIEPTLVPGGPVVVEDDLLVELLKTQTNHSFDLATAAIKASTSSGVLYR